MQETILDPSAHTPPLACTTNPSAWAENCREGQRDSKRSRGNSDQLRPAQQYKQIQPCPLQSDQATVNNPVARPAGFSDKHGRVTQSGPRWSKPKSLIGGQKWLSWVARSLEYGLPAPDPAPSRSTRITANVLGWGQTLPAELNVKD